MGSGQIRRSAVLLLIICSIVGTFSSLAQGQFCEVCKKSSSILIGLPDGRLYCKKHARESRVACSLCLKEYRFSDPQMRYSARGQLWYCQSCSQRYPACHACGVPVAARNFGQRLSDGRTYCREENNGAVVFGSGEASIVFYRVKQDVRKRLGPNFRSPLRLSKVQFVNKQELTALSGSPYCLGLTMTKFVREDLRKVDSVEVTILKGMDAETFYRVCVHEYAHACFSQFASPQLWGDRVTQEGFAEWVTQKVVGESDKVFSLSLEGRPIAYRQGWMRLRQWESFLGGEQELLDYLKAPYPLNIPPVDVGYQGEVNVSGTCSCSLEM